MFFDFQQEMYTGCIQNVRVYRVENVILPESTNYILFISLQIVELILRPVLELLMILKK
jgi:hypothetical protein